MARAIPRFHLDGGCRARLLGGGVHAHGPAQVDAGLDPRALDPRRLQQPVSSRDACTNDNPLMAPLAHLRMFGGHVDRLLRDRFVRYHGNRFRLPILLGN